MNSRELKKILNKKFPDVKFRVLTVQNFVTKSLSIGIQSEVCDRTFARISGVLIGLSTEHNFSYELARGGLWDRPKN